MDSKAVLQARIQALRQEIQRANRVIESLDPKLRNHAGPRFSALFQKQRDGLTQLDSWLGTGTTPSEWWKRLADIQQDCDTIFREAGAFMQGVVVRTLKLDDGLCELADALVSYLKHRTQIAWWGLTIPADEEFVAEMAQIIRLRSRDVSIWNLPVAAHEFGHLVAQDFRVKVTNLPDRWPFQEIVTSSEKPAGILHEYFADLFATYTLGPAYACTCILLRFNPGASSDQDRQENDKTHPSDACRVHFILRALERAKRDPATNWQPMVDDLRDAWRQSRVAAGRRPEIDRDTQIQVEELVDLMFTKAMVELPGVGYKGWLRAQIMAPFLQADVVPRAPDPDDSLADALNAAWLARIQPGPDVNPSVRDIGKNAEKVYRQIMVRN